MSDRPSISICGRCCNERLLTFEDMQTGMCDTCRRTQAEAFADAWARTHPKEETPC